MEQSTQHRTVTTLFLTLAALFLGACGGGGTQAPSRLKYSTQQLNVLAHNPGPAPVAPTPGQQAPAAE